MLIENSPKWERFDLIMFLLLFTIIDGIKFRDLIKSISSLRYCRDPNEHGSSNNDGKTTGGLIFWEPYTLGEQRYLSLGELFSFLTFSHFTFLFLELFTNVVIDLGEGGGEGGGSVTVLQ